ncbi:MAG: hypothetical protein H7196_02040 [candidate division SR1 bacterium]|nr:hypothetical protein [candidate division SR1 bacterium]
MSNNRKTFINIKLIALINIIIILSVAGYFGYVEVKKFINKRNEVVTTLNKNTDLYNSSTEPAKELLISFKNLLDFNNLDDTKVQVNIGKLDLEIPKINTLSLDIDKSSQNLEKGIYSDSQNIYTLFNESLTTKKATLDLVGDFVKYEVCLVKNSSSQYQNISQFSDQLTKFSNLDEKLTPQERAAIVDTANKKINDNILLTKSISDCFNDKYSKFLLPAMKDDLTKDNDLYTRYADATKSISEGLVKNNGQLIQNGSTQLLELKDKNPVFFNSENFKKAVQEPKKMLQDQAIVLENQEKKIKNQVQTLKSKYLLD